MVKNIDNKMNQTDSETQEELTTTPTDWVIPKSLKDVVGEDYTIGILDVMERCKFTWHESTQYVLVDNMSAYYLRNPIQRSEVGEEPDKVSAWGDACYIAIFSSCLDLHCTVQLEWRSNNAKLFAFTSSFLGLQDLSESQRVYANFLSKGMYLQDARSNLSKHCTNLLGDNYGAIFCALLEELTLAEHRRRVDPTQNRRFNSKLVHEAKTWFRENARGLAVHLLRGWIDENAKKEILITHRIKDPTTGNIERTTVKKRKYFSVGCPDGIIDSIVRDKLRLINSVINIDDMVIRILTGVDMDIKNARLVAAIFVRIGRDMQRKAEDIIAPRRKMYNQAWRSSEIKLYGKIRDLDTDVCRERRLFFDRKDSKEKAEAKTSEADLGYNSILQCGLLLDEYIGLTSVNEWMSLFKKIRLDILEYALDVVINKTSDEGWTLDRVFPKINEIKSRGW